MSSDKSATNARACQLCRQKKRKCNGDGSKPSKACLDRDADCVYIVPARVSKADLRDEVARLQSVSCDDNAILDTIASKDTSPAQLDNILRRLSDGQPRAQVASLISHRPVALSRLGTDFAFARDSGTHCSAALVDSLLALGALAAKDYARLAVALAAPSSALDPDSLAQAFANEAMFALHNGTDRPRRITDIQSFGVLSLYNVSCYRLKQATEFAGDFRAAIAELWCADRSSETHASSRLDKAEHAGLYCAASHGLGGS
ncbi:hypothetical protein HC256_000239 [Beauveria bassiana]|nr:hypothetical protein HC256_000239 [Beauveria bassiana]